MLCIEKAASGQSLIQVLRKEAKIPVVEMKPLKSKTTRLQAVTPFMESNRVYLLDGPWTEGFIKELTAFPFTRHDDRTDAFAWALTYYAMEMDVVDRGLQESIIANKRFYGDLRREGFEDRSAYTELPQGNRRGLQWGENQYNSPDYDSSVFSDADPRSHLARGRRGGRGRIGYE
jgi:hypothetical protein